MRRSTRIRRPGQIVLERGRFKKTFFWVTDVFVPSGSVVSHGHLEVAISALRQIHWVRCRAGRRTLDSPEPLREPFIGRSSLVERGSFPGDGGAGEIAQRS